MELETRNLKQETRNVTIYPSRSIINGSLNPGLSEAHDFIDKYYRLMLDDAKIINKFVD
jgi:hypothetical protein